GCLLPRKRSAVLFHFSHGRHARSRSRIQSASSGNESRDGPPCPLPGNGTISTGPLTRCFRIVDSVVGMVSSSAEQTDRIGKSTRSATSSGGGGRALRSPHSTG